MDVVPVDGGELPPPTQSQGLGREPAYTRAYGKQCND